MVIKLKNKLWIILVLIIIIGICIGFYFFNQNKKSDENNYSSTRTSTEEENYVQNDTNTIDTTQNATNNEPKNEELISTFSTKILSWELGRQNNINLTCQSLNGTIVANGSTFSFCNTLGPATPEQGYQEAYVFDEDGDKEKGLGGGKCQVSTTLYNAVLNVPNLVVTERHAHSHKVPYIQPGKDAAVSYGSYDLKFRNDTGFDVKIEVTNTTNDITINLYKII